MLNIPIVFIYFCAPQKDIILYKLNYILFLVLLLFAKDANAQNERILSRDSTWRSSGIFSLNVGQTSFTNWANGGENQININTILHYRLQYSKGKASWENNIEAKYGTLLFADMKTKKTDDKLDYASKFGYQATDKWNYSYYLSFSSQFSAGYKYPNDSTMVSDFMAPGYFMAGAGMDYNPIKTVSILINPITYKLTIVNDELLARDGNFGVKKAVVDTNGNVLVPASRFRSEPGAFVKIYYQEIFDNGFSVSSKLELFSSFVESPENIDVTWSSFITYRISEYFAATFSLDLLYDDDAIIKQDVNGDGIKEVVGPRMQSKQTFGVGISLRL